MWNGKRVSVVLPTYAERGSIRRVINEFETSGLVDEILVVNNNAESGTSGEIALTSAIEVLESRQGYGYACRRGLAEATGDLIILAEPDGTFLPGDVWKLLVYSDDCEVVFGTRTTQFMIWHGANMGLLLKWGNWAVAKMVEFMFNTTHLSDVGCTYRLLSKTVAHELLPSLKVGGSHFGAEIILSVIAGGYSFIEIPVNYLPRVGTSSVTGHTRKAIALGLTMIAFIVRFRLTRAFGPSSVRRPKRRAVTHHPLVTPLVPAQASPPARDAGTPAVEMQLR
jgi:glycosyltransferase involved in cell wall biosynthesis